MAVLHATPRAAAIRLTDRRLDHQGFQRPPQHTARQTGTRLRRAREVLAPDTPATGAQAAAQPDAQDGRTPAGRHTRQLAGHAAAGLPVAAAAVAPAIRLDRTTQQGGPLTAEVPACHDQTEAAETAERGQAGRDVATLGHVEVFEDGQCENSISQEPQPTSRPGSATDLHPHP